MQRQASILVTQTPVPTKGNKDRITPPVKVQSRMPAPSDPHTKLLELWEIGENEKNRGSSSTMMDTLFAVSHTSPRCSKVADTTSDVSTNIDAKRGLYLCNSLSKHMLKDGIQ